VQGGIPKRPYWVLRNDNYVTRREDRPYNYRGRGGIGGGGARGRWAGRGGFGPSGYKGGSGKM
jgi:hypothetical protein